MPYAYIIEPGAAVKAQSKSLVITKNDQVLQSIEIAHLCGIVLIGRIAVSTPALFVMLHQGVQCSFIGRNGKLRGKLTPPISGASDARLAQYSVFASPETRLQLSKSVVQRKYSAMCFHLEHHDSINTHTPASDALNTISHAISSVMSTNSLQDLLEHEARTTKAYWAAFRALNQSELPFQARKRRPPPDPVNAMLGFGYALATNEIWGTAEAVGLDPFLGFYHQPKPHRPSLALDVVEPFRHAVIDRLVLESINTQQFTPSDFEHSTKNGVRMSKNAIKRYLMLYEETMNAQADESVTSDFKKTKLTYRELLRKRCQHLATWFRKRYEHPILDQRTPSTRDAA